MLVQKSDPDTRAAAQPIDRRQRLEPWAVGWSVGEVVAVSLEDGDIRPPCLIREPLDEDRLPDPGFPSNEHEVARSGEDGAQVLAQNGLLPCPSDQRKGRLVARGSRCCMRRHRENRQYPRRAAARPPTMVQDSGARGRNEKVAA